MARVCYERGGGRNGEAGVEDEKEIYYACKGDYNSQRLSAVQPPRRRPPRHLLEAWYFWLGIALLVASVSFSVSITLLRKDASSLQATLESVSKVTHDPISRVENS